MSSNNIDFEKYTELVTFNSAEKILYAGKVKNTERLDLSVFQSALAKRREWKEAKEKISQKNEELKDLAEKTKEANEKYKSLKQDLKNLKDEVENDRKLTNIHYSSQSSKSVLSAWSQLQAFYEKRAKIISLIRENGVNPDSIILRWPFKENREWYKECPKCGGSGCLETEETYETCNDCHGTGKDRTFYNLETNTIWIEIVSQLVASIEDNCTGDLGDLKNRNYYSISRVLDEIGKEIKKQISKKIQKVENETSEAKNKFDRLEDVLKNKQDELDILRGKYKELNNELCEILEEMVPFQKKILDSDSILFSFYPKENIVFRNKGTEKQYDPYWYLRGVLDVSRIRNEMPFLPVSVSELGVYANGYMAEVFDWKTAIEEGKPNLFIEAEAREGTENKMDMLDNFVATMLLAFPPKAVRFNILEGNHPVNPFLRKLPDKVCQIYDVTSDSESIRSLARRLKSAYSESRENPVPDCQPREFVVIAGYDRKDRNFTKILEELRGVIENGKRAGIYFAMLLSDDILNYDWSEEQVSDVFDSFTPYSTIMKCEKGDDDEKIWIPDYGLLRSKAIVPTDEGEVEGTLGELIIKALHDMTASSPNKVYDKLQDGSLYDSSPISDLENQPKADMGKLVVPIAESESGDIINLKLDDEGHIFYFILGKSGSGKSFTLHTILTNLMLKYDPSAVEVILMDFKPGGVEMNYYKDVPHVSSLLVNGADRQVAGEILQSIIKEMSRRGEVFQKYGSSSISRYNDYASKNGLEQMKHIVLLVDECQDLFKIGNPGGDTNIVTEIARKGRSYGIHMILATQTLQGADIPGDALKQFTDFLFMLCSEDDVVKCEVRDRDVQNRVGKLAKGEVIYVHQGGQEAPRHGFVYNYYGKDGEFGKKTQENLLSDRFTNPDKKQFYFNASQIYHLDDNEIKKLIEVSQSGLNPVPRAVLGKNLSVKDDTLYAKFGKGDDANLLILGANNRLQGERVLWNAVDSLYQANEALGNAARYYILPNIPEDVDEEAIDDHKARLKMVREIADRNGVVLVDEDERSEIIERVAATVRVRQQVAEEDRKALKNLDNIYLVIPNQQLFSKKMGRRPKGLETLDRNLPLQAEANPVDHKPVLPAEQPTLEIDDFGFEGLIMPGEEPKAEANTPSFLDIDFDTFDMGAGFEKSNSSGKDISAIHTPKPGRDLNEELRYILEYGPSVKVHVILQSTSPDKIYAEDTMREKEMNTYFRDIVLLFMQQAENMSLPVDGSKVKNLSPDPKSLRAIAYSGTEDARTMVPFDFDRD